MSPGGESGSGGDSVGSGDAATDDPPKWPVELRGVTESVVTTRGPEGRWNVAALGLHAAEDGDNDESPPVTARTWGETRTRRNFRREGGGYVQFVRDPVLFVEAALSVTERSGPVLDAADAWVEVAVERVATGESGGTDWAEWALRPVDVAVERTVVPTIDRGFDAVVEATVAASRLEVAAYDREELVERLEYLESVVESCGGLEERRAFERLRELSDWG